MNQNKIIIEVIGRTFILPMDAVYSFNNAVLDVYAPNFEYKFNKADIQQISLLDMNTKITTELLMLKKLIDHTIPKTNDPSNQEFKKLDDSKPKEPKKEVKLTSGMI
ncbi:hypothetical protein [Candidatus Lokiarchaeum ossiferum]|uniref:hypothetical protein n=1 Tax=Candidatus Lokiarchaeum ossiferum TaxID=2951803 RepID=UPI00352F1B12